jgi:hypothetical protein
MWFAHLPQRNSVQSVLNTPLGPFYLALEDEDIRDGFRSLLILNAAVSRWKTTEYAYWCLVSNDLVHLPPIERLCPLQTGGMSELYPSYRYSANSWHA